jgi:hypothetical protein
MDRWLADSANHFVRRIDELAGYLDAAIRRQDAGVAPAHWPSLTGEFWLRRLVDDLKAACDRTGEAADPIFMATLSIVADAEVAIDAYRQRKDLAPWRSCRDRVCEHLGVLRASGEMARDVDPVAVNQTARPPAQARGLNLTQTKGEKGEEGEKPLDVGGRPRKGRGASRQFEAAWWRDRADFIPEIRDAAIGDAPEQLFELLNEHGDATLRGMGREPVPAWWPKGPDQRLISTIRFRERFAGVSADTFKKYLQRHDNAQARPVAHRHNQDNVQPPPEPLVRVRREDAASAATREIEDAMELVAELVIEPHRRDEIIAEIRKELSARGHWADADVDHLCELTPEDMTRTLQRRLDRIEEAMRDVAGGTKSRR